MIRGLFGWFTHLGIAGLVLLGILDSSFLFLPLGNDVLLAALVARNHSKALFYVLAATAGSTVGVMLLDLVSRRLSLEGLSRVVPEKRLTRLVKQVRARGWIAILVACISPPPFPFTAVIIAASSLQYPRTSLFTIVALARAVRFSVIALLAVRFGSRILRITRSGTFEWFVIGFAILCLVGSVLSIRKWLHGPAWRPSKVRAGN